MANGATVTKARGGKSGKTRTRRNFWSRALQAPKVKAALTELEVDLEAFEKSYDATRKTREARQLNEAEIKALNAYREHKSFDKLAADLTPKGGKPMSVITAMFRVKAAIETGVLSVA
jgi:hypothetical protein